jgi:hypothetical protein
VIILLKAISPSGGNELPTTNHIVFSSYRVNRPRRSNKESAMTTKFRLLALVGILVLAVTTVYAAAYEPEAVQTPAPYVPEAVPVHPVLLDKYKEFFPPASNTRLPTASTSPAAITGTIRSLIEGVNGLIVIDPGRKHSRSAGRQGWPSMPTWTTSSTGNRSRRSSTPTTMTAISMARPSSPMRRRRSSAT